MSGDTRLRVLPVADTDHGSQRCRMSGAIIDQLGVRLGAAVHVNLQGLRLLCTVWPQPGRNSIIVQPSRMISVCSAAEVGKHSETTGKHSVTTGKHSETTGKHSVTTGISNDSQVEADEDAGDQKNNAIKLIVEKDTTDKSSSQAKLLQKGLGFRHYRNFLRDEVAVECCDITITDIVPVLCVRWIRSVHVEVIVSDYTRVKHWRTQSEDATFKVRSVLRSLVLCNGATVDARTIPAARLFGVAYVRINAVTSRGKHTCDDSNNCSHGRFTAGAKVIVDKVLCLERFEQLSSRAPTRALGGLDRELALLTEILRLPSLTPGGESSWLQCRQGVLLQGPAGCGKTTLVHQLAYDCQAFLQVINGAEVFSAHPGETEHNLRVVFDKVETISREGPSILFLDELDALCPAKGRHGSVERRVVSQLLSLIDHMISVGHVTVIGATNQVSALDPAVRRPGRLEKQILIGVPNISQRESILHALTTHTPLSPDIDLSMLAESTPGFVGADLSSLVQQAHYGAVTEYQKQASSQNEQPVMVKLEHFKAALHTIVPSTQRGSDILVDYTPIQWHDIGGLDDVKVKLKQAVEWPIKHPEAFQRLGIPRPRGILLYGPPGCAKTTLVRAAATSCHVTFLAISGGQLYSPYVGDSERKLSQVFQQARAGAPSILFIDELDSVIGSRSQGNATRGVQERVLSTLLNEMDGIGIKTDDLQRSEVKVAEGSGSKGQTESLSVDNQDVLLVAATNRPDMLDDAILRPGRIDRIIYVPPPDTQARAGILQVHTRKIPLEDVDLEELANQTAGFTGADLENLCREAVLHAMSVDGLDIESVNGSHFEHVLRTMKPSLTPEQLQQYAHIKHQFR